MGDNVNMRDGREMQEIEIKKQMRDDFYGSVRRWELEKGDEREIKREI